MKKPGNRTRILVSALALLTNLQAKSQVTFVRMYNEGDAGYSVREVNGNSYVVAGGTDYYYNWHWMIQSPLLSTNIHLYKTDVNGILQWERVISRPNTRMIARWMEPVTDGGFIITGSSNSDLVWPPDSNDVVLIKTNATGMVSWCKVFDTGKDELGFCVQQTADSGYILSGFHDALPVSLAGTTRLLLIKTDAAGNIQWEKKYQFAIRDFNTHEPYSYVVKQTSDGGYILTGTNAVTHPADAEVLRTDATGNVLWAKTYEHDNSVFRNSLGLDIIETASGDFLIAGSMDKLSPLNTNYPYFLLIDDTGNVLKQRFFETLPLLSFQSGFSSVQQTADGGFFFTGMGGYSGFGQQAQLLKTNPALDMVWSRVYTMDGIATVSSRSGRQTSDGGYVFTGKRQNTGSILMKTNSVGMVACKFPNSLIEYTPSVTVSNWNPAIVSGINTSNVLLTVNSPLVDTTVLCPVTVPSLPVELNFFAASAMAERKVRVDWSTASEINNAYFIIERSIDNLSFEETGKVIGAGNSTSPLDYTFVDENPYPSAVAYYRLQQVDFDGTGHFSKTVPVSFSNNGFEVTGFYADYENAAIRFFVTGDENEIASYLLCDAVGKIISSGSRNIHNGATLITIDMRTFDNGIYILTVRTGTKTKTVKGIY